jgi:2-epi-5-epi-valiolone epimerase
VERPTALDGESVHRLPAGVPGANRVDHVGITVPDLDIAIDFAVEAFGGELVYRQPRLACDDDWMQQHLDVHPRAAVDVALVGLGPTANLELFQYWAPDQKTVPPGPGDVGSTVLGFFVDDVDVAAATLRDRHGLRVYGPASTTPASSPCAGMRWARLPSPWGVPIELRSVPSTLPYERQVQARRFGPCPAWSACDSREDPVPLAGLRNVDHVACTVADLDQALEFFRETLGADLLYRTEADLRQPDLAAALGMPPEGTMELAALRMGPTDNVELSCFRTTGARATSPRNSDVGGRHLAIHVDDVDAAAAYLASAPGCTVLGSPDTVTEGPIAGDRWVYVRTPLGLHIELINMPDGSLPYELETPARRRYFAGQRWSDR